MFTKDLIIGDLLDIYGELLTGRKAELLRQYYDEDLSLSEISENEGMSRQGARALIKKGEGELLRLEEKLGLCAKQKKRADAAARISSLLGESGAVCAENADSVRRIIRDISEQ